MSAATPTPSKVARRLERSTAPAPVAAVPVVEEPLQDVAYLYDGTLEGLLCAVFAAYERHEQPTDVVREAVYEPRLGQSSVQVPTDFERAGRVRRGILRKVGRDAFTAIVRAQACDDYDAGTVVYRFIRHVMALPEAARSQPVLEDLAHPAVADLRRLSIHAANESERMRQFVRFSHLENGVWYAKVNPNASVVPLVMGYFADRLNDQPFIIYDEVHHLAGVYDGRRWQLVAGDAVNLPASTARDSQMQHAWQRFYDALSVDARYNPELRRQFIPARLQVSLPEFAPRPPIT